TSNPSICEKEIVESGYYDEALQASAKHSAEDVYLELALEDLQRAAKLFAPIHRATHGADGWASLEVSPLLADDADGTIAAVAELHRRAERRNVFIKIPGTPAGARAIEESLFAGIPIN